MPQITTPPTPRLEDPVSGRPFKSPTTRMVRPRGGVGTGRSRSDLTEREAPVHQGRVLERGSQRGGGGRGRTRALRTKEEGQGSDGPDRGRRPRRQRSTKRRASTEMRVHVLISLHVTRDWLVTFFHRHHHNHQIEQCLFKPQLLCGFSDIKSAHQKNVIQNALKVTDQQIVFNECLRFR